MALPPLIYTIGDNGKNNRITTVLRSYWEYLKEDRGMPSQSEIQPEAIKNIWNDCFIVKADNSCMSSDDYKYTYIGEQIKKAFGEDLTGMAVEKMAAPQAGHLAQEYEKVLATKLPIFDEGEISLPNGKTVKYRQILLPLGENGIIIKAILGGMSYKIFD